MTYYLFAWSTYYPEGGWSDHRGTFGTESEARQEFARLLDANEFIGVDYARAQIVRVAPAVLPAVVREWDFEDGWVVPE